MKPSKLMLLVFGMMMLGFSCNKKDSMNGNGNNANIPPELVKKLSSNLSLQNEAAVKFKKFLPASEDVYEVVDQVADWLQSQEKVKDIYSDGLNILIKYQNGLRSFISFTELDSEGMALTRGGGGGDNLERTSYNDADHFEMGNGVLIFSPFNYEFYHSFDNYPFLDKFSDSKIPLDVTVLPESKASFSEIKNFGNYGLVIMNTHGSMDAFYVKTNIDEFDTPKDPEKDSLTTEELNTILSKNYDIPFESLMAGELDLGARVTYKGKETASIKINYSFGVTTRYIEKQDFNHAVVFGNFCHSGQDKIIPGWADYSMVASMKKANVGTYYAYAYDDGESMSVANSFAIRMEDSLITNLVINGDSTGMAHLANGEARQFQKEESNYADITDLSEITYSDFRHRRKLGPFYFKLFESPRYKYGCGTFTDTRDDQTYLLACIGDQVWFAENLRYTGAGIDYDNNPANRAVNGRLYTMQEAMEGKNSDGGDDVQGVCPAGWHVPSRAEFNTLFAAAGEDYKKSLRSVEGWEAPNTNKTGFNMVPSGGFQYINFIYKGAAAYFWTSTGYSGGEGYIGLNAYYPNLALYGYTNSTDSEGNLLPWRFSVRCIQD